MKPEHLQEDLKMEVITTVCEWPEERVVGLHERKQLEFYVARVIINHITNKSHQFYKKYRTQFDEYVEHEYLSSNRQYFNREVANQVGKAHIENDVDLADRETKEAMEDIAINEIEGLYWYDQEMVKLYYKLGSYRAIEEQTGIPFISCYKTIQKAFATIRNKSIQKVNDPLFSKKELAFIQNGKL